MLTTSIDPQFGVNYDIGWTGFSQADDAVGNAIVYGERFERGDFPAVNHAFTVVGENSIVEAQLKAGVVRAELTTRTLDPKQKVYFRKPLMWTEELGRDIAIKALSTIGARYDDILILENALADTLLGRAVNLIFAGKTHQMLDAAIAKATPGEFICSYDVAYALAAQPAYKGFQIFKGSLAAIDPMLLMVAGPYEPEVYEARPPNSPPDETGAA